MTGPCPLCEREAAAYEVYGAHFDATARDNRLDYVALERDLKDVLDYELTVAGVKRHFHDHIVYVFDPAEAGAADMPVDGRAGGSPDDQRSWGKWRWRR